MFKPSHNVEPETLASTFFSRPQTLNRSTSRIVIVIVPVAFIAGAPCGCPALNLHRTRHF